MITRSTRESLILFMVIGIALVLATPGCYTYRSVAADGRNEVEPEVENAVRVTLKDGSVVESSPFMHIVTREPSDLVFGIGEEQDTPRTFKGSILSSEIDSIRTISTADGDVLVCRLKNKTLVEFKPGEYLRLTRQDPPGLWCMGKKTTKTERILFSGLVALANIRTIEQEEFSIWNTAVFVLFAAPIVALTVFYIALRQSGGF